MRLRFGASGAERLCALGAVRRGCPAPQLHRYTSCDASAASRFSWVRLASSEALASQDIVRG